MPHTEDRGTQGPARQANKSATAKREALAERRILLSEKNYELASLRFHWTKWTEESKGFWHRASLSAAALVILNLYQIGGIQNAKMSLLFAVIEVHSTKWTLLFANIISWWLLCFLIFKFFDLLRHRLPQKFYDNKELHNEELSFRKVEIPLKDITHYLYFLVFPGFVGLIAICLAALFFRIVVPAFYDSLTSI